MLNGVDPIIIFNLFKKLTTAEQAKFANLPIAGFVNSFALPPIPIYLSESLTGLYVDSEDKNIDIDTNIDALIGGSIPEFNQKPINTVVKINLLATKDSIGLNILSALADLVVPLLTSKEYSLVYLHGSTTIFGGLLHSFSVSQNSNSELQTITIEIVKTSKKPTVVVDSGTPTTSLNNSGPVPQGGTSGPSGTGPSGGGTFPIVPIGTPP